jgi:hypothetical protein
MVIDVSIKAAMVAIAKIRFTLGSQLEFMLRPLTLKLCKHHLLWSPTCQFYVHFDRCASDPECGLSSKAAVK